MSKQVKADLGLILVTLGWGVSYVLMRVALSDLGPMTLNLYRFGFAFVVSYAIFAKRMLKTPKKTYLYAFLLSLALTLTYVCATYGVMYTSVSNAGFLCALTCVVTPLVSWVALKQKPDKKLALVIVMVTIGIAMLSLNEELKVASGDIICLGCAFFYGIHMVLLGWAVSQPEVDALELGILQLGFTGLDFAVLAFIIEEPHIPVDPKVLGAAIFLSVFCTGLAFIIQSIAQKYTAPSHVGIIFTLEPVFSAIFAYFTIHERLSTRGYIGAALMFLGVLIMETNFSFAKKKNETET